VTAPRGSPVGDDEALTVEDLVDSPTGDMAGKRPPADLARLAAAINLGAGKQSGQIQDLGRILMGKPYRDLVEKLMADRKRADAAVKALPGPIDARPLVARNYELEALRDVAEGVDIVAANLLEVIAAQKTTAEAQDRTANAQMLAADQLLHVGELIEAGDRGNTRLAKIALAIAGVSVLLSAVSAALQIISIVRP
jgi:hypothetical protein